MAFDVNSLSSNAVLIRVGEFLDFRNAEELKGRVRPYLRNGALNFILDFSETRVLDSSGLGALFWMYRQVAPKDGRVAFADVSGEIETVVHMTSTYEVFPQFPSVQEAKEALSA